MGSNEVQRLYAAPCFPAPVADEFTESARAALLWVLWHHPAAAAPLDSFHPFCAWHGQHEYLSGQQVADAKRWAAVSPQPTRRRRPRPRPFQ